MISKITGTLVRVDDGTITLEIPPMEYEVLVSAHLQSHLVGRRGETVTLWTIQYLEGNPMQGRLIPRLVGFRTEAEREFFDLFCSVDGVGAKKALKALACSVPDLARAIHQEDTTSVSGLPGIGDATADRIVAKLRRKVAKFALMVEPEAGPPPIEPDLHLEALEALRTLGHSDAEARRMLATISKSRRKLDSLDAILNEIYKQTTTG